MRWFTYFCKCGRRALYNFTNRIVLPDRVSAVIDFPPPTNVDSVRQFIGIAYFVGKYISNKSNLLEPLNALLKKKVLIIWDYLQINVFDNCKKAPTSVFLIPEKPIMI